MTQLKLIVKNELITDLSTKSFWISTLIVPLLMGAFGVFGGLMMEGSDSFSSMMNATQPLPDEDSMTPLKIYGMMLGIFPVIFLMMYGSMIFNKVKTEKCNRIVEILATCVDGRTMMLAKIISIGLTGLIQLSLWLVLGSVVVGTVLLVLGVEVPLDIFSKGAFWTGLLWALLFFIGGYVFYGSLFAAVGAMTDKNNENQEYVAVLTFVLLGAFYIGEYAVDNASGLFVMICSYLPFTSSTVLTVTSVSHEAPLWLSISGLAVLYVCAFVTLALAGKIYTSSLLLKGKRFSPKDIIVFLKSK